MRSGKTIKMLHEVLEKLKGGKRGLVICGSGHDAQQIAEIIKKAGHGAVIQVFATPNPDCQGDKTNG